MVPGAENPLPALPYFAGLGPEEKEKLQRQVIRLDFDRGEIVFLEGHPCRGLYVVEKGQVRIYKSSPEGREQVLLIAGEGDSFNEVAVFDEGPNPASAAALTPSTVYLLPRETLLSLVADCPPARAIIKAFAMRLRHLTTVVEKLSFHSVVNRLAGLLLEMAVAEGGKAPVPRFTQDEMAGMVGSVRDVVGRALRILESHGAIKIEGRRLLVVDKEKLREMAEL
ncbi:MAG: Crp/Fnr family transcriptional regulator [Chloroflexota bacterium]